MASGSSRVLRSGRSSRMTPYSVSSERKSRNTPSESNYTVMASTTYHVPIVKTASPVDTSGDSTLSPLTTDQLAVISKGLYTDCTIRVFGYYSSGFLFGVVTDTVRDAMHVQCTEHLVIYKSY